MATTTETHEIGNTEEVAARKLVARGRVGRRVGPGPGDSPHRVATLPAASRPPVPPLGRASGPGVRPVGPSSRARWVRVAPVSAQRSAHSAPNRPDSPHFCARLGHFSARLGHSFVRLGHFSARLGHSFVRLGHLSGRLGRALYLWLRKLPGFGADALHDSRCRAARVCHEGGAGLSPCARNTIREAISRDTSSSQHAGHAARRNRTRSAAGTFSGHRQRSRRICHQKCGCRLSPKTSGSSTPRDRACSSKSRSSSERVGNHTSGGRSSDCAGGDR